MGLCHSLEKGHRMVADDDQGLRSPRGVKSRIMVSLHTRQGKRGTNQDSAILCQGFATEEGVLCGVFDGHGRNGHIASKLVRDNLPSLLLSQRIKAFLPSNDDDTSDGCDREVGNYDDHDEDDSSEDEDEEYYSCSSPEMFDEWKEACLGAFKAMDRELGRLSCCYASGTTAVTVIKQGKDLIIANLGDSRAILGTLNEEGNLEAIQLTTDLKPDLPHEAERIKKSNGRVFALRDDPNRHRVWLPDEDYPGLAMARAFGDFQLKNYGVIAVPRVSYRRVREQDQFVILATDGVWDVLSNEEVASIAWSVKRREDAAKAIVKAAARAWKLKSSSSADDCTVVCLSLQDVEGKVTHHSCEDIQSTK